ncbi:hypothetical protein KAU45_01745 [bacterium]|nr:hypothetical protein [bacterium]
MKKVFIIILLIILMSYAQIVEDSNLQDRVAYLEGKLDAIEKDRGVWDWELIVIFGMISALIILVGVFAFINQNRFNRVLRKAVVAAAEAQNATQEAKQSARKVLQIENTLANYINKKIQNWEITYNYEGKYKYTSELPILVAQVEILESMGGIITPEASFYVGVYYFTSFLNDKAIKYFKKALSMKYTATYTFLSWANYRQHNYKDVLIYVDQMEEEVKYTLKLDSLLKLNEIKRAEEYYYDNLKKTKLVEPLKNILLYYYIEKYKEGDVIPTTSVEEFKEKVLTQARHFTTCFDTRLVIQKEKSNPHNLREIIYSKPNIDKYIDINYPF